MQDSEKSFQEKGKIFTPIVNKKRIKARIQTTLQLMEGHIYIHPDNRISDELNQTQQFLPVTDATIFSNEGNPIEELPFVTIQISQIVWISPIDEIKKE
jgi:hypothetical protein